MWIDVDRDIVFNFLREKNFEIKLDSGSGQYYHLFQSNGREYPLFIRLDKGNPLLQLILFLPITVPSNKVTEVGRVLHLLNRELDWPGFCIDERQNILFYRFVVPSVEDKFPTSLIENAMQVMPNVVSAFLPLIVAAIQGTKFEKIQEEFLKAIK